MNGSYKKAMSISGIPLVLMVAIISLCVHFYKPTPFNLNISNGNLVISNWETNPTTIKINEIKELKYLNTFNLGGNDFGVQIGNVAKGRVLLENYGEVNAFVMNKNLSGIYIETKDSNAFLINYDSSETTKKIYDELKSDKFNQI